MNSKELGKEGEIIAQNYLIKKGYEILDLNFEAALGGKKFGEIDIVARKKAGLFKKSPFCFIEVKAVLETSDFSPEDKIDFKKQKKLKKMAEIYLTNKKINKNASYQIDIIAIRIHPLTLKLKIKHLENAIEE